MNGLDYECKRLVAEYAGCKLTHTPCLAIQLRWTRPAAIRRWAVTPAEYYTNGVQCLAYAASNGLTSAVVRLIGLLHIGSDDGAAHVVWAAASGRNLKIIRVVMRSRLLRRHVYVDDNIGLPSHLIWRVEQMTYAVVGGNEGSSRERATNGGPRYHARINIVRILRELYSWLPSHDVQDAVREAENIFPQLCSGIHFCAATIFQQSRALRKKRLNLRSV